MILIAHRGNISGKEVVYENHPDYILNAISLNYYAEIDIWYHNEKIYLGHDEPNYEVNLDFLDSEKYFVHCKNNQALEYLSRFNLKCDYFWHQNDDYTLTSKNKIWVYPTKKVLKNSIVVLPELSNEQDLTICQGLCSDVISNYVNLS